MNRTKPLMKLSESLTGPRWFANPISYHRRRSDGPDKTAWVAELVFRAGIPRTGSREPPAREPPPEPATTPRAKSRGFYNHVRAVYVRASCREENAISARRGALVWAPSRWGRIGAGVGRHEACPYVAAEPASGRRFPRRRMERPRTPRAKPEGRPFVGRVR
jgi:hypothetical protein